MQEEQRARSGLTVKCKITQAGMPDRRDEESENARCQDQAIEGCVAAGSNVLIKSPNDHRDIEDTELMQRRWSRSKQQQHSSMTRWTYCCVPVSCPEVSTVRDWLFSADEKKVEIIFSNRLVECFCHVATIMTLPTTKNEPAIVPEGRVAGFFVSLTYCGVMYTTQQVSQITNDRGGFPMSIFDLHTQVIADYRVFVPSFFLIADDRVWEYVDSSLVEEAWR